MFVHVLFSVLHQSVDVMLRPVLGGGDLEHVGHAEEGLPRVPVGDHLKKVIVRMSQIFI